MSSFFNYDLSTWLQNLLYRYRVHINPRTGLISSIQLRISQVAVRLKHTFATYDFTQKHLPDLRPPGAYVFTAKRGPEPVAKKVKYSVVKGPLVEEIHQEFNPCVSQVIALHKDSPHVEFTWTVRRPNISRSWCVRPRGSEDAAPSEPSMNSDDSVPLGSDTVSVFHSDLRSHGFHTDSNGWRNVRRTMTYEDDKLPIPANFYPIVSWIYIEDVARNLMMVIFPDRPQGGTSQRQGHMELMVYRWHSTNDDLGNPEPLEEIDRHDDTITVAKGTHRLFLGSRGQGKQSLRHQALGLVYRPLLAFGPAPWKPKRGTVSGLRYSLPKTVHVLTLERLSESEALLRLEHLALTRKTAQVNVTRLLVGYRLSNLRPLTLGANQFLPGATRHRWPKEGESGRPKRMDDVRLPAPEINIERDTGDAIVTLWPGEIATFLADLITE
ncbi:lysosomal alpha-mannosidase-like [Haemaphysalis longicornis]